MRTDCTLQTQKFVSYQPTDCCVGKCIIMLAYVTQYNSYGIICIDCFIVVVRCTQTHNIVCVIM